MPRDLGQLQIESVVLHQVPDKSAGEPDWNSLLSEAESELTPATRNYLLERIVKSLASAAYEAVFDAEASSPIPKLVADYHEDDAANFIDLSRQVAQYLHGCQNRPRQGGLLTVIQTSNAGRRSLVILKMEQDEAVGLQRKTIAGKATYSWEHRTDLALNSHRRVLKVGLFERRDSEQTITALVSDKQKGYSANKEVADFFLKRFLGCKLAEAPEVTTKRFFQLTQDFINGQVEDSITKAKYYFALLAELNSQQDRLDPSNFAMSYLNLEHRKPYEDFCVARALPLGWFEKDIQLIESHLRRILIEFDEDVSVIATSKAFSDENVTIEPSEDGQTKVHVQGHMKRVQGRK